MLLVRNEQSFQLPKVTIFITHTHTHNVAPILCASHSTTKTFHYYTHFNQIYSETVANSTSPSLSLRAHLSRIYSIFYLYPFAIYTTLSMYVSLYIENPSLGKRISLLLHKNQNTKTSATATTHTVTAKRTKFSIVTSFFLYRNYIHREFMQE